VTYIALPTKNPGDVLTSALWNTYLQGNADSGFMRKLADSTLTVAASSFDFTSIPATFAHLMLVLYLRGDAAATNVDAVIRFNADSGANYDRQLLYGTAATAGASETLAGTSIGIGAGALPGGNAPVGVLGQCDVCIAHYAGSAKQKSLEARSSGKSGIASGNLYSSRVSGFWRSTAAINEIQILTSTGNWDIGSRATLYGLPA
jgi:hypothetical protein